MRAEELMLRVSRVDQVPSEVVKSNKKTGHQNAAVILRNGALLKVSRRDGAHVSVSNY